MFTQWEVIDEVAAPPPPPPDVPSDNVTSSSTGAAATVGANGSIMVPKPVVEVDSGDSVNRPSSSQNAHGGSPRNASRRNTTSITSGAFVSAVVETYFTIDERLNSAGACRAFLCVCV